MKQFKSCVSVSVFAVCVVAGGVASGQNEVHVIPGFGPGDRLGFEVCGLGDVDGDGVNDFAATGMAGASGGGHVTLYSGGSGAAVLQIAAPAGSVSFGFALSDAGDLNGDGIGDVLISDPGAGPLGVGVVNVHSGADGAVLLNCVSPYPGRVGAPAKWGFALDNLGDITADGVPDYLIGAPGTDPVGNGQANTGHAAVVSGATGVALSNGVFVGVAAHTRLGQSVANAGDINADGICDFVIASPGFGGSAEMGMVAVYSGATRQLIAGIVGVGGARYGAAVAGLDDINGDGYGDLAVTGAGMGDHGAVEIASGQSMTLLNGGLFIYRVWPQAGTLEFGFRLRGVGDVNLDGVPEIAISDMARGVGIHSGVDGKRLYEMGHPGGSVTRAIPVDALGDVTGDGCADFIMGLEGMASESGALWVLNGSGVVRNFGVGAPNQSFASGASIGYAGSVSVADDNLTLTVESATANDFGLFFYGDTRVDIPLFNGNLYIGDTQRRLYPPLTTDNLGRSSLALSFASLPPGGAIAPGDRWYFQCWYRDAGSSNFSDGLSVLFAP
ncbi:MAG: hypothetical protein CMJ87_04550 [Planctomycetes bacterium]|nr:hypothetical protein [Planctomycetota bacterium]